MRACRQASISRSLLVPGNNVIAAADLTAPCQVLSGLTVLPCAVPISASTGLACDADEAAGYRFRCDRR